MENYRLSKKINDLNNSLKNRGKSEVDENFYRKSFEKDIIIIDYDTLDYHLQELNKFAHDKKRRVKNISTRTIFSKLIRISFTDTCSMTKLKHTFYFPGAQFGIYSCDTRIFILLLIRDREGKTSSILQQPYNIYSLFLDLL